MSSPVIASPALVAYSARLVSGLECVLVSATVEKFGTAEHVAVSYRFKDAAGRVSFASGWLPLPVWLASPEAATVQSLRLALKDVTATLSALSEKYRDGMDNLVGTSLYNARKVIAETEK